MERPMRVRIGFASGPRTRFQLIALQRDDLGPESRLVRERITHPSVSFCQTLAEIPREVHESPAK